MDQPPPAFDDPLIGLGLALALGLLVGLQREWTDDKPIGLRSFALIALLGGVLALLRETMGAWPVAGGIIALGLLLAGKTRFTQQGGITTFIAALVVYGIGAAAADGHWLQATVIGGTVTLLLHWKGPMHGLVDRMGRDDIETIARFVLITLVVLPLLPDESYGPYDVFNPFNTWLLVVLIVTINLAGYVVFRALGADAGAWLAGIIGGLVSSTATTLSYTNLSREGAHLGNLATLVILVASAVVYPRIALEVSVVAPALLQAILWPSALFMAVLLSISLVVFRRVHRQARVELPGQENPARIRTALTFGAIYVVILFAVAAARDFAGGDAVYVVAFVSGLTDVDALTLSTSRMFANDKIESDIAWRAIFLASLSNLLFKTSFAAIAGSAELRRWILGASLPALLAGLGILAFWP
jgi:uncharacterized membrane protein (DUF4010 family)